MKLRNLHNTYKNNDGTRTLVESTLIPEFIAVIKDLAKSRFDGVLIGGLAVSLHLKPRATTDLDFLFNSDNDIPVSISGFKRIRKHEFQHNDTHVEVKVVSPEFLNNYIPVNIAKKIIETSVVIDGIRVASKSGLIAAKLGRLNFKDKDDIINLIKSGDIDMSPFPLSDEKINEFNELVELSKSYR